MPLTLVEHISVDPKVFRGRPCIRGTRIPVDILVDMRERDHLSPEEIAEAYDGAITLSDVYAAFSYYYDHRDEIQRLVDADEAWVEQWKRDNPGAWKEIGATRPE